MSSRAAHPKAGHMPYACSGAAQPQALQVRQQWQRPSAAGWGCCWGCCCAARWRAVQLYLSRRTHCGRSAAAGVSSAWFRAGGSQQSSKPSSETRSQRLSSQTCWTTRSAGLFVTMDWLPRRSLHLAYTDQWRTGAGPRVAARGSQEMVDIR